MNSNTPPSSSPNPVVVDITLPTSWDELDEPLLIYILRLMAAGFTFDDIRSYIVIRKIPRTALRHIPTDQLAVAASHLKFLETPPDRPLRPAQLAGGTAINAGLQGVLFRDYLIIENLWQGFMDEQAATAESLEAAAVPRVDTVENVETVKTVARADSPSPVDVTLDSAALRALLPLLFPGYREKNYEPWHALAVVYWIQGLKALFAQTFPNLFRPTAPTADAAPPDMRMVMETQIRALTDGDVTKREAVLSTDTWAALTELDAKAREAEEINAMRKK